MARAANRERRSKSVAVVGGEKQKTAEIGRNDIDDDDDDVDGVDRISSVCVCLFVYDA